MVNLLSQDGLDFDLAHYDELKTLVIKYVTGEKCNKVQMEYYREFDFSK